MSHDMVIHDLRQPSGSPPRDGACTPFRGREPGGAGEGPWPVAGRPLPRSPHAHRASPRAGAGSQHVLTARGPLGRGTPARRRLCPLPALLTRVRLLGETDAAHNKQTDASAIEGAGQRRPLSPRMAVLPSSSEKQGYPSADRNRVTNSNMGAVLIDDRKTW